MWKTKSIKQSLDDQAWSLDDQEKKDEEEKRGRGHGWEGEKGSGNWEKRSKRDLEELNNLEVKLSWGSRNAMIKSYK